MLKVYCSKCRCMMCALSWAGLQPRPKRRDLYKSFVSSYHLTDRSKPPGQPFFNPPENINESLKHRCWWQLSHYFIQGELTNTWQARSTVRADGYKGSLPGAANMQWPHRPLPHKAHMKWAVARQLGLKQAGFFTEHCVKRNFSPLHIGQSPL